jgi:hypothetical protein
MAETGDRHIGDIKQRCICAYKEERLAREYIRKAQKWYDKWQDKLGYINYGRHVNINPYDPYMYVGSGGIYYSYTIISLNSKVPDESLEDVNTLLSNIQTLINQINQQQSKYEEILKLLSETETRLKEKL